MTIIASISIAFQRPGALVWLGMACLPVLLAAWTGRHGRRTPGWAVGLQCAALGLLALSLAGPELTGVGRSGQPWLVVTDVSASVRGQVEEPIIFADGRDVDRLNFAGSIGAPGQVLDETATNIAAALRLAAGRAAEGKLGGVVIRTDGQFTADDWRGAARQLGQTELPVAIIRLGSPTSDARVTDVTATREVGEDVAVRVSLAASGAGERMLTVRRSFPGGKVLLTRELSLRSGDVVTLRVSDSVGTHSGARYVAELSAGDTWPENDAASTAIGPRTQRVLYLASNAPPWPHALADDTDLVIDSVPLAGTPDAVDALADYACIILADPAGDGLTLAQRTAIGQYVRAGGGLVLVGSGPRTAAADRDDPLNQVAAIVANPYDRAPLAVTVVLDASGSMSQPPSGATGRPRFAQASQAVMAMRRYLTDGDSLSVVTFADKPKLTYDSGDGAVDFAAVSDALRGVTPAGPTHAGPAISLAATPADGERRRLVILVSDLMSEPFDVDAAAEALGEAEASLAVVAIGTADGDSGAAILRSLASAVDGRFEQLGGEADLSQLAGIFGQFVSSARGGAVRRVEPRTMDLTALALAEGIVMPPLNAYILSAANGQDVEVFGRVAGDAVLALRRAGLGRSAGLAVHLRGKDNEAWQLSPKTSRLIVALAQWALRPGEDGRFTGQASRSGGQVAVRIEASDDGTPINDLQLSASVVGEAGEAVSHPLEQTAPGRYELHLPADGHARWLAVSDADGAAVWRQSLAGGYAEEFSKLGADGQRLSELAALAGGQMVYRLDQATVLDEPHLARGELSLWPALLGASLALMLIEWASVRARRRSA